MTKLPPTYWGSLRYRCYFRCSTRLFSHLLLSYHDLPLSSFLFSAAATHEKVVLVSENKPLPLHTSLSFLHNISGHVLQHSFIDILRPLQFLKSGAEFCSRVPKSFSHHRIAAPSPWPADFLTHLVFFSFQIGISDTSRFTWNNFLDLLLGWIGRPWRSRTQEFPSGHWHRIFFCHHSSFPRALFSLHSSRDLIALFISSCCCPTVAPKSCCC